MEFQKQNECIVETFFLLSLEGCIKSFLTHGDPDRAIRAFITSQLDHCSAMNIEGDLFLLS